MPSVAPMPDPSLVTGPDWVTALGSIATGITRGVGEGVEMYNRQKNIKADQAFREQQAKEEKERRARDEARQAQMDERQSWLDDLRQENILAEQGLHADRLALDRARLERENWAAKVGQANTEAELAMRANRQMMDQETHNERLKEAAAENMARVFATGTDADKDVAAKTIVEQFGFKDAEDIAIRAQSRIPIVQQDMDYRRAQIENTDRRNWFPGKETGTPASGGRPETRMPTVSDDSAEVAGWVLSTDEQGREVWTTKAGKPVALREQKPPAGKTPAVPQGEPAPVKTVHAGKNPEEIGMLASQILRANGVQGQIPPQLHLTMQQALMGNPSALARLHSSSNPALYAAALVAMRGQ